MGNIVLLDELTINKIAAGEVIERPASVIKEMVENSIDAGATNITVEIKNGGISYIRVTDNGKGIAKDDLEIAFERHATSKIRTADDLDTVTSMGFRGEALASIAAISNVEMVSKTKEQDTGYKIVVEAGDVLEQEEVGCQNGTSITVKNLFFNTPVRYKFLKKDYTESGYIEDVITRIALVNPNISIKLINTGKTVIQTNGNGDLKSVIYSIYGKDIANGIMEVEYKYEDITVTGVVGKPEISRSNRANQVFFVNKRYIKDKTLSAATEQAYKGLIPIGKFGFVVLNLEINPAKVDVNVHPAKLEVRFEEENKVFQSIYHAIKDTLLKNDLVTNTAANSREGTFEERLQKIRNSKGNQGGGLFDFRKQNEKKIEEYTEQESKIKTNSIEENKADYSIGSIDSMKTADSDNKDGISSNETLINTSDVLKQLREMKEKIEQDLENKNIVPVTMVRDNETKYDYKIGESENTTTEKEETKEEKENSIDGKLEISMDNDEDSENKEIVAHIDSVDIEAQDAENKDNKDDVKDEEDNKEIEKEDVKTEELEIDMKEAEELDDKVKEMIAQIYEKSDLEEDKGEKEEQGEVQDTEKIIENIEDPEIQKEFNEIKQKMQDLQDNPNVVSDDFNEMYAKLFGRLPVEQEEKEKEKEKNEKEKISAVDLLKDNVSVFDSDPELKKPEYRYVGIVFKTYIILEIENEMYILDQHAAHERIMYEKVKKNYYSDKNKDSQMLLLPDIITLTHKEMDIANDNMDMFQQAGFSLEEFGENTIKLSGVPAICVDLDTKELFLETLDEINTVARTAKQEKEEKFIATVACKAAVKANMALTDKEVESLMNQLFELPNPFTCPHGRPTVIKMTKYDIERKFARK